MPATLKILGTQLPIYLSLHANHLVRTLKYLIRGMYCVPVERQTLRLYHGGQLMSDGQTLASYGITNGDHLHRLQLSVAPADPDVLITVGLQSGQPQFTNWRAQVRCRETTTLGEFKRLVADQLRWAEPNGMKLFRGGFGGRLDVEENMGRMLPEFLIMDQTVLWVEFTTNVPQNGVRPHQILPPPAVV